MGHPLSFPNTCNFRSLVHGIFVEFESAFSEPSVIDVDELRCLDAGQYSLLSLLR